jgi:hypothetical protein
VDSATEIMLCAGAAVVLVVVLPGAAPVYAGGVPQMMASLGSDA